MNVQLVDRVPTAIAYRRHTGPYGETVHRSWEDDVQPGLAANGLGGRWACTPFAGTAEDPVTGAFACQLCIRLV